MKRLIVIGLLVVITLPVAAQTFHEIAVCKNTNQAEEAIKQCIAEARRNGMLQEAHRLRNNGSFGGMSEAAAIERQLDREAGIVRERRKPVITNCTPNGIGGMNCVSR